MTEIETDILIVGAGQAGAQTAISLRQEGFEGRITIVGEEADLPYERPPLSKEYLSGERPPERLLLRPPAFWAERQVDILTHTRITEVKDGVATAEDGRRFRFDKLVWAAGGHARRLSCGGAELGGVHVIRTRQDDDNLRADLHVANRVVVIGGGYVGLEAAAVLRKQGKSVTLVEAQPRLLARVAAAPVSDYYLAAHEAHGVEILLDAQVDCLLGETRITGVRLTDGRELPADLAIVGIGLIPSIAPLGLDALEVDGHGRTGLPGIYAVGDCATHRNRYAGNALIRLESVQNAVDMAKAAAAHIVHGDTAKPYEACPWFWSNQYDLKLQTVGLSAGHDETVVRGDPATGSWSLVYLRGGAVIALDCINAPRDYVQGKALVERGARIAPTLLADGAVPLKQMEG
ncbi:FAD-dependent oxidoreductase [Sandaracinobacter sp. RS1-74]|uniref:NAD(P)/FAD-dependent oxidoreductase n=1 Tax=Sandaracinobacteroides sayramensis TaxID=2913411 RepID=UPI001EDC7331|nr:FAD-dependent oxidoreductase [Sandaracinobacteroides sayramensis]MCG2842815.1 FAD-dependent oxidoreductase [Sandaracinobacteroides sayramensis]